MDTKTIDGYYAPIHRSLVQPIYWMGVPRSLLLAEVFLSILCGAVFKTFFVVFVAIVAHFIFRYLGSKDKLFLDVFLASRKHKNYYYR